MTYVTHDHDTILLAGRHDRRPQGMLIRFLLSAVAVSLISASTQRREDLADAMHVLGDLLERSNDSTLREIGGLNKNGSAPTLGMSN